MLGSDFPHAEGVAEPAEFLGQLPREPEPGSCARLYGLQP